MSGPAEHSDLGDVVTQGRGGAMIRVRVKLRSRRRGVLGVLGSELSVAVGAPPEAGRANAEALATLAGWLGLPVSALSIASGAASRSKGIRVIGADAAAVRERIAARLRQDPR